MRPTHPVDGIELIGTIEIDPPLSGDDVDLLETIELASFRGAVQHARSGLVDQLAPDHPDGPSCWTACPDGCCLGISPSGFAKVDAMEPWLAYIVTKLFPGHTFRGAFVLHDCADRTFTALSAQGSRVRRTALLRDQPRRLRAVQSR